MLKGLLAQEPADIPDIHPNVSGIYRKKVERLTEALNAPRIAMRRQKQSGRWLRRLRCALVRTAARSTPPYTANWARSSDGSKRKPLERLETRNSRSFRYGSVGIGGCGDMRPSQIAFPSSGLRSHLMLVADGIQLGSLWIFAMFSRAVPTFRSFTLQFSSSLRRRSKVNSIWSARPPRTGTRALLAKSQ